jgi:hypothetical protein
MEERNEMLAARLHYLFGSTFTRKPYRKPSDSWDHDHCQVCWRTIAEFEGKDATNAGYASIAIEKWKADYYWICSERFEQHREHMRWAVAT